MDVTLVSIILAIIGGAIILQAIWLFVAKKKSRMLQGVLFEVLSDIYGMGNVVLNISRSFSFEFAISCVDRSNLKGIIFSEQWYPVFFFNFRRIKTRAFIEIPVKNNALFGQRIIITKRGQKPLLTRTPLDLEIKKRLMKTPLPGTSLFAWHGKPLKNTILKLFDSETLKDAFTSTDVQEIIMSFMQNKIVISTKINLVDHPFKSDMYDKVIGICFALPELVDVYFNNLIETLDSTNQQDVGINKKHGVDTEQENVLSTMMQSETIKSTLEKLSLLHGWVRKIGLTYRVIQVLDESNEDVKDLFMHLQDVAS